MLIGNALSGGGASLPGNVSIIDALPDVSNLKLCVDVGDSNSLANATANTSLLDLSLEGNDLIAGSGVTADSLDPAFNGTIGALSDAEYVTMDGVQDSAHSDIYSFLTNPAWMENIHKDSAVYTILVVGMLTGPLSRFALGNGLNSTQRGFRFFVDNIAGDRLNLGIMNVGNNVLNIQETGLTIEQSKWFIASVGVDEPSAMGLFTVNGQAATFTSTYTSPGATDAARRFSIGNSDFTHGVTATLSVGARFAGAAIYEGRMLPLSEINSITENLYNRFQFGE